MHEQTHKDSVTSEEEDEKIDDQINMETKIEEGSKYDEEVTDSSINENELFKLKIKYQIRGLFRKNATLQKRQVGTNICQILTPVIGLFVVHALRQLGESSLDMVTGRSLYIPIPYIFNIPYKPFSALTQQFSISDCDQWYLYDFDEKATNETR